MNDLLWQQWWLIGFLALGVVLTIATIGKPRKPTDPATAVVTLILSVWHVYLVASL